ncbi:MAG: tyrosine-type recombinase/integrase, partial [Alistipes senegalensis]|nr:tyrosine-type recombinase/integrase [Alistipes senegalensis]
DSYHIVRPQARLAGNISTFTLCKTISPAAKPNDTKTPSQPHRRPCIMLTQILARLAPSLTLVSDWCAEFEKLISLRSLHPKTINKRKGNLAHLKRAIGQLRLGAIRPIHIAEAVHQLWQSGRQNTARRVLLEARELFAEAVSAGLITTNPAIAIKPLPVKIRRQRMRLEELQALYEESLKSEPAWVSKMLLLALVTGQRRADLQKMAFADVRDNHLFIEQQKTGERIALPLKLRLKPVNVTLGQVIKSCRDYVAPGKTLLRKDNGQPLCTNYMTARFRHLFVRVLDRSDSGYRPTLHECRSLSERLYREQGINTQILLGHRSQAMTDQYNDMRGLDRDRFRFLAV